MQTQQLPFNGEAKWIWSAEGIGAVQAGNRDNYRVRYFRRTFSAAEGQLLIAHVSADSRYVLWCNGVLIDRGPSRGDVTQHFYETYDLSAHLKSGENVLAAFVVYCGDVMPTYHTTGAPCGLMTGAPGFIVDAVLRDSKGNEVEPLNTDARWKVLCDKGAYRHQHTHPRGNYTGFPEGFRGEFYPWGWTEAEFDDSVFGQATEIFPGVRPDNVRDSFMPHRLMPRPIPMMESKWQRFERVVPEDAGWEALLAGKQALEIPANTQVEVQLSMKAQTTALPRLRWSGGKESRIRLTYAEMLTQDGVRQYVAEPVGDVIGIWDEIFPGGGPESWQSWAYRTYRYVKVEIETGPEPLRVEELQAEFWAYPFELKAEFECDDTFMSTLFEVGFRTLRLCSHETYEDCPYYEQLSYAGDNYVTGQAAGLLTGDSRLTAHTLRQFFWSRHPNGLTMSRYPSRMPQIIPAFSLFWLQTVRTYYEGTGDLELVLEVWDGIESVLRWFEEHREEGGDGLVGKLEYWCVLDWSPDWAAGTADSGVPPGTYTEASAANSFLHIWGLRAAAEMAEALGNLERSAYFRKRADGLTEAAHAAFFDEKRGAYRDRRQGTEYSQLTNALSIISGAAPEQLWPRLVPRLTDSSFCRAGYFGEQFVLDALAKAGEFGSCWDSYEIYRQLIVFGGSTTLPEAPSKHRRSECHAWSVGCVNALLKHGLGIQPLEAGWKSILIAPQPGPRTWMRGAVPVPGGRVEVELRLEDGEWKLKGKAPNVAVTVRLPGQVERVFPTGGEIQVTA